MIEIRASSADSNGAVFEGEEATLGFPRIGGECSGKAEEAAQGIIGLVQPAIVSEKRREAVIEYVQRLIKSSIGCEVFPFGSVPLKTYLPDGDIDMTAFGALNMDEKLANDVFSVLKKEDQNKDAKFVVKDVQLIRAEVKLVKCLVQNIVVDISFNQLGGLCTLCFLEKVDHLIGKDHLFKRSIILIKAWCYYESRILGAHHGLISTYALETLVLYIFHLFHSSLNGPLAVLYNFLDYFSKFDWDNYCISLNGPVRLSSLPEFVVETPENGACDLLLSNDFMNECVAMFSVPTKVVETNSRAFSPKHLNIVDPLKENNNLGRSVSKGNFYRIRSAFSYGARKLGRILSQPEENISDELHKFFPNTLDRHGSGHRPDVQDPVAMDQHNGFGATLQFPGKDSFEEDQNSHKLGYADSSSITREGRLDHKQSQNGLNGKVSGRQMIFDRTGKDSLNLASRTAISENRLSGDAKDLATARIQVLPIPSDNATSSSPNPNEITSSMGKAFHAPHLYFSSVVTGNGEVRNGNPQWELHKGSGTKESSVVSGNLDHNHLVSDHEVLSSVGSTNKPLLVNSVAWSSEDLYPGHSGSQALNTTIRNTVAMASLSDLSGDYESQMKSLNYGRWWYENVSNASVFSVSPPLLAQFQGKNSWDVIRRSVLFRQNAFSHMNVNGAVPTPVFYPMSAPLVPGATFGLEEMPKPRGTGTYFPNTNHYRERPLISRARNQAPIRSPRNNGRISNFQEPNFLERNSGETSQTQFHRYHGGGSTGSAELHHSVSAESKPYSNANGSMHLQERGVEFAAVEHLLPVEEPVIECVKQSNPGSVPAQTANSSILISGMQRPEPVLVVDQERISLQSYQLIDDDFPPLSDSSGKGSPVCKKLEKAEQ